MQPLRKPDFGDFLDFLIIATLATGALFAAGRLAKSDDRFTIERPAVKIMPAEKIDPVPLAEPLPSPKLADSRPVVYVYSAPAGMHCAPCVLLDDDIEDGELDCLRFEHRPSPAWVSAYPTLHYQGADGQWYRQQGYLSSHDFLKQYRKNNPAFNAAADAIPHTPASAAPAAQGSCLADQFRKFAGEAGSFEFKPDQPVNTTLDDGTAISYRVIRGRYSVAGGVPKIVLADPLPTLVAQKFFMRFGVTLQDATYEPPSSVFVGTSRGRYRVDLNKAN